MKLSVTALQLMESLSIQIYWCKKFYESYTKVCVVLLQKGCQRGLVNRLLMFCNHHVSIYMSDRSICETVVHVYVASFGIYGTAVFL